MRRSHRRGVWFISIFFGVALVAGWWVSGGKYTKQILAIKLADPDHDAAAALATGDKRYVAVMGAGLMVPGVPDWWKSRGRGNVRVIPNTSDAIETPQHALLQSVARDYAERYNRALLKRLASATSVPSSRPVSGN